MEQTMTVIYYTFILRILIIYFRLTTITICHLLFRSDDDTIEKTSQALHNPFEYNHSNHAHRLQWKQKHSECRTES